MVHEPAFLARLGLDATADERAIRRAYARLLKQIDLETEADRFQSLREDYEAAIAWHASPATPDPQHNPTQPDEIGSARLTPYQAPPMHLPPTPPRYASQFAQRAAAPIAAAAAPVDVIESSDPDVLAAQVYALFLSALPRLRQDRMQFDESLWADHLRRCQCDERLTNLAASAAFEARIVALLAGARQPGHDTLFNAAVNVFGWAQDRRRLHGLQAAGMKVSRAIDERHMLHAQPIGERRAQKLVFAALRSDGLPHPDDLRRLIPLLESMLARFPALMAILVDPDAVARWRHAFARLAPVPPSGGAILSNPPQQDSGPSSAVPWTMAFIVIAGLLRALSTSGSAPPPPAPVPMEPVGSSASFPAPAQGDQTSQPEPGNRPPARAPDDDGPLSRADLAEIKSRFLYTMTQGAPASMRVVELEVSLDAKGRIEAIAFLRRSGDRRFDDDVEKAVWDCRWFPGARARMFKLKSISLYTDEKSGAYTAFEATPADGLR